MDILYYSNYCKHSQKVIQFLAKNNLTDKLNFICIDKRQRDPKTGQTHIQLENGKTVILPPNVHNVPSLLLVKQNYRVVLGDEIIATFQPRVEQQNNTATLSQGEPAGYQLLSSNNGMNIVSEQFTYYSMTPEELSAKGKGGNRQMYNYVLANHTLSTIETPPDNYRPDKLSSGVTIDTLQQKRNDDVPESFGQSPFSI
jgi:hypothetical protein